MSVQWMYLEYLSPDVFILNKLDLTRFHLFLGDRTPRATLGCIFLFSIPIQFQVSKKFTSVWLILYESWVITCENWLLLTWRFGQTRLIFIHWNGRIASISNPYKFSSTDHIIFGWNSACDQVSASISMSMGAFDTLWKTMVHLTYAVRNGAYRCNCWSVASKRGSDANVSTLIWGYLYFHCGHEREL